MPRLQALLLPLGTTAGGPHGAKIRFLRWNIRKSISRTSAGWRWPCQRGPPSGDAPSATCRPGDWCGAWHSCWRGAGYF